MDWVEFSVQVDQETVEGVAEVFHRYGQGGIAIESLEPDGIGEQNPLQANRPVLVKVYVPADHNVNRVRRDISQALRYLSMIWPIAPLQERRVAQEDWESGWKEHFHVHRPGERTVIVPSWREYTPKENDIPITLDPGMAFGTGLHPTTQLCVRQVEKRVTPGMEVLDVGTGSGILAILAAKLGARRVLALDVDALAVDTALENVECNGVEGIVQVEQGTLPLATQDPLGIDRSTWSTRAFDLVLANITANVIGELAPALIEALKPEGLAVCSGIIEDGFPHAIGALLATGAQLVDVVSDGDWRAMVLKAPQ